MGFMRFLTQWCYSHEELRGFMRFLTQWCYNPEELMGLMSWFLTQWCYSHEELMGSMRDILNVNGLFISLCQMSIEWEEHTDKSSWFWWNTLLSQFDYYTEAMWTKSYGCNKNISIHLFIILSPSQLRPAFWIYKTVWAKSQSLLNLHTHWLHD